MLAEATETDVSVAIPAITVATGVTDSEGDALTLTLTNEASTTDGLISPLFASGTDIGVGGYNAGRWQQCDCLARWSGGSGCERRMDGDTCY